MSALDKARVAPRVPARAHSLLPDRAFPVWVPSSLRIQALAGRQTAYAMIVRRYEKYVFNLAFRFLRSRRRAMG